MKRSKRIIFAIIMVMMSITLISCGEVKPENILESTFAEINNNTNDSNIKFFELGMQKAALGQTSEFLDDESKELIKGAFSKLQYKINSEEINGDTATFNVTVVGPDIALVLSNTAVKRTMSLNNSAVNEEGMEVAVDMSDSNINEILRQALKESFVDIKTNDRTATITMKKVDGKWEIEENDEYINLILGKAK